VTNTCETNQPEITIEITQEMLDAGIGALISYDSRVESVEEAVRWIYEAMRLALAHQGIRKF